MAVAGRRGSRPLLGLLALLVLVVGGYLLGGSGSDPEDDPRSSGPAAVSTGALPPEVADTLDLIDRGGPFPYERDGAVFENREGLLPSQDVGYYREYTVPTPGEDDRGARRLVTGGDGEVFYTADHYESFVRIRDP